LFKGRTNHNIGVQVHYLHCKVKCCPKQFRYNHFLGGSIIDGEEFTLEEIDNQDHNHNVVPEKSWGLTPAQKLIVTACFQRKQSAPRRVSFIDKKHIIIDPNSQFIFILDITQPSFLIAVYASCF
jgi:hypothetical protein